MFTTITTVPSSDMCIRIIVSKVDSNTIQVRSKMEDGEGGKWLGHVLTPPLVEAAIMVLTDMGLALLSVVANLMVINSLREKEALLAVKQNLVNCIH